MRWNSPRLSTALCLAFGAWLVAASPAWAAHTFVTAWGSLGSGNGQFNQPRSVVTDPAGNVYVADLQNSRVQKFTPNGAFLATWGSQGSGDGQFGQASASGLAVDGADNVYVADRNNHRIQKFTSSGTFVSKFGSFGVGNGQLSAPEGVAVDAGGNVFVAEYSNHRIQKFNAAGAFVTRWGTRGAGPGQFEFPRGVAVDPAGNVYVADSGNSRIQKFDSGGGFITTWGSVGTGDGQFINAPGVAVDGGGSVYVADFQNRRIQQFSFSGAFLDKFGSSGTGPGQFNRPIDVAVHQGDVYVSDFFAHRISRFQTAAVATPPPVLGRAVNVQVVKGKVSVALPAGAARASQTVPGLKGRRFAPLSGTRQVPVGSLVDTRKGTVRLTSARDTKGTTQTGDFAAGVFQVLQSRRKRAKGLTELRLKGSSFAGCKTPPRGRRGTARGQAAASRRIRRLRSNARGRFRTRGRHSAATVRGTKWTVTDRCDGTLTTVQRGRVTVRDFRRRKTITVKAGKRYLARAPR